MRPLTPTPSEADRHATFARPGYDPVHAPTPPAGLVDTTAFPSVSVATQSPDGAHEIHCSVQALVTAAVDQATVVGAVEVMMSPLSSTAAHSDVVGQEIWPSMFEPSTAGPSTRRRLGRST